MCSQSPSLLYDCLCSQLGDWPGSAFETSTKQLVVGAALHDIPTYWKQVANALRGRQARVHVALSTFDRLPQVSPQIKNLLKNHEAEQALAAAAYGIYWSTKLSKLKKNK